MFPYNRDAMSIFLVECTSEHRSHVSVWALTIIVSFFVLLCHTEQDFQGTMPVGHMSLPIAEFSKTRENGFLEGEDVKVVKYR